MAWRQHNRVCESSTTTGTGSISLAGAVPAHRAFGDVCDDDDEFYYLIAHGSDWEFGFGRYDAGGNALERVLPIESSNGNDAVDFGAGTKSVSIARPASDGAVPSAAYGHGGDGSANIASGATTLSADTYYHHLTLTGTGKLQPSVDLTAGSVFRIFVSGILDLSAAAASAIDMCRAAAGLTGNANTGSVGGSGSGGNAGSGGSTNGSQPAAPSNIVGFGGAGGAGGKGGDSASGTGGNGRPGATVNRQLRRYYTPEQWSFVSAANLMGGAGGGGGGGGAGNGSQAGSSGGLGSSGAPVIMIFARVIKVSGTPSGPVIDCKGNPGANGVASAGTNRAGGGGGGGSGGGGVVIVCDYIVGSDADAIACTGGAGSAGGPGNGTGQGGNGGGGGEGGSALVIVGGTPYEMTGSSGTAGGANSGTTPGSPGSGGAATFPLPPA